MAEPDGYNPGAFREAGRSLVDRLAELLERSSLRDPDRPVLPWVEPDAQVDAWDGLIGEEPTIAFDDLARRVVDASHDLQHPRYIGHQVSAPAPLAALTELITSVTNNGMAVYEMGPVGAAMERAVVRWMAARLGFDAAADGVLVSGGSLGNLTALLAARQAKAGFDAWAGGAHAGPPLALLVSEQAHYCVKRAVQVMGWGAGGAVPVETDDAHRLKPGALAEARARAEADGRRVIAVVASSCTTPTGAYDPIEPIADFCESNDLWLHVDGAHGASAAISPDLRDRVAGIERADSVVWDAHKLLAVPSLSTGVLFREGRRSFEAFAQEASYLFDPAGEPPWWDGGQRTLECTRRVMALPLFTILATQGERWLRAHVERLFETAQGLARLVREAPDFELATEPQANIVCYRLRPPGVEGAALDRLQVEVRDRLVRSGGFYIVRTALRDGVYMRSTVMNPLTDEADLRALLDAIRAEARRA